jgi:hypothetical protein
VSPWECTWHEETVCKDHWPVGPVGGRLAKSLGRLANLWVGSDQNFLDTCLHEKGKAMAVEKVSGSRTHWPAGHHLVSYRLGQVSGAPPWPYKYPHTSESRHTPHFKDSTYKSLFLSVVARRSLAGEWHDSEGQRASWPVGSPPRSSSVKALLESFGVGQDFSALVCSSMEALSESYGFRQRISARVPQVYRDSGLSGFPRHYLRVADLPIIVSYPITSLMLFVHLYIVW